VSSFHKISQSLMDMTIFPKQLLAAIGHCGRAPGFHEGRKLELVEPIRQIQ
jgi:hypothetical protein